MSRATDYMLITCSIGAPFSGNQSWKGSRCRPTGIPLFRQAPWPEYGGAAGPLQPKCPLRHTVEPIMVHDNGVRELTEERQRHKEDCSALALREASKSAAGALVAAAGSVFAANSFFPGFRRALGTSGKAALVVRLPCNCLAV